MRREEREQSRTWARRTDRWIRGGLGVDEALVPASRSDGGLRQPRARILHVNTFRGACGLWIAADALNGSSTGR